MTDEFDPAAEDDDIIAAIHATRRRIWERFGNDSSKYIAYLIEEQKRHGDRLIPAPEQQLDLPPRETYARDDSAAT